MIAEAVEKKFQTLSKSLVLQVQWDGKQMPDLEQLLAIPSLAEGTGEAMALAIANLLRDWQIPFDMIGGMVFDTTSSNTGSKNGACALLEEFLNKKLLYFACCHHVYEIILRAALEHFMGGTSGPDVLLFKNFQKSWDSINQANYIRGVDEPDVAGRIRDDDVLRFALRRLQVIEPTFTDFIYVIFLNY